MVVFRSLGLFCNVYSEYVRSINEFKWVYCNGKRCYLRCLDYSFQLIYRLYCLGVHVLCELKPPGRSVVGRLNAVFRMQKRSPVNMLSPWNFPLLILSALIVRLPLSFDLLWVFLYKSLLYILRPASCISKYSGVFWLRANYEFCTESPCCLRSMHDPHRQFGASDLTKATVIFGLAQFTWPQISQ